MSEQQSGKLIPETVEVTNVHSNLSQEIIKITTDKLKLILKDYLHLMERKNEWIAPLGIVITLLVVLTTTSFKEAYFSADTWKAIFVITLLLSSGWLLKSFWYAIKSPSVEEIVERIKKGE